MFVNPRKLAQQTAQHLLSGHCTLVAWWTLRHAGVFDAILKQESEHHDGLDPLVYATRSNMAPEVLSALLVYLASAGLLARQENRFLLSGEGKALLEHEDALLEVVRAYQPVLDMAEHLLAKLKTYGPPGGMVAGGGAAGGAAGGGGGAIGAGGGVYRKSEYLLESQARRYAPELFPAVQEMVARHHLTHLLDVACGSGELLVHLARKLKQVVGVGIGSDTFAVRRANAAIAEADLEKRLIAIGASPLDVCTDTQRTFDRIGISRQLWNELDGIIATTVFSELAAISPDPAAAIARTLSATRRNFPKAALLLIEPVASERFQKNYYAPELSLLLRLARSSPWPAEKWRELVEGAKFKVAAETSLTVDGLTLFLCKPV